MLDSCIVIYLHSICLFHSNGTTETGSKHILLVYAQRTQASETIYHLAHSIAVLNHNQAMYHNTYRIISELRPVYVALDHYCRGRVESFCDIRISISFPKTSRSPNEAGVANVSKAAKKKSHVNKATLELLLGIFLLFWLRLDVSLHLQPLGQACKPSSPL